MQPTNIDLIMKNPMDKSGEKNRPSKIIIDVAHPGTSAPSSNSKSVIVTNRTMLEDPMVNKPSDTPTAVPEIKQSVNPDTKSKIEIKPLSEPTVVNQAKVEVPDEPESKDIEPTAQSLVASDKQVIDKLKADEIEKTERDAEIQSAIDSKQYFLPINTVENRHNKRVITIGVALSFVLILVWIDIALDAGIIKLGGLHAVTHFF